MRLAFLSALIISLILAGVAGAEVNIDIEEDLSYTPDSEILDTTARVSFNEYVPRQAMMQVHLDQETIPRKEINLDPFLKDEDEYSFRNQTFTYDVIADGTLLWKDYSEQEFRYILTVSGKCGGDCYNETSGTDSCVCPAHCGPENYPCDWSVTLSEEDGTVDGSVGTGLKHIFTVPDYIIPESFIPGSLIYSAEKSPLSPDEVELTMRQACGHSVYGGITSEGSGWMIQEITIDSTELIGSILHGTGFINPFDEDSIDLGYRRYGGPLVGFPHGGIFKEESGEPLFEYLQIDSDVEVNGTTGKLVIKDLGLLDTYIAVYLPPNGPRLCAYTTYSEDKELDWQKSYGITAASVGYQDPYTRVFTGSELSLISDLRAPDCDTLYPETCVKTDVTYSADMHESTDSSIDISSSYQGNALTVFASTTSKFLVSGEWFDINLSEQDISITDIARVNGNHTLELIIRDFARTLTSETFSLFVCNDLDRDGYCADGGDCDDYDFFINPGRDEICNGIDDNCDGYRDENITRFGQRLGEPCQDWKGSICAGKWECNADGSEILCKSDTNINPGDREEACGNFLDDDCDELIDESDVRIGDVYHPKCIPAEDYCLPGDQRPCGACRDGTAFCVQGKWGNCFGATEPGTEVCNRFDDDCDGKIDNIMGKETMEETLCRCTDGGFPSAERCNGIDDNCNSKIDEGVGNCCDDGKTETCGLTDVGKCEFGIRSCSNGQWSLCNAVLPEINEICCNEIDDDCNGKTDEDCAGCGALQSNAMLYWTMIGAGVLILLFLFVYIEFIRKKEH